MTPSRVLCKAGAVAEQASDTDDGTGGPNGPPRRHPLRAVWSETAEGFVWLLRQRIPRTMAVLIGLLDVTLTAATTWRVFHRADVAEAYACEPEVSQDEPATVV